MSTLPIFTQDALNAVSYASIPISTQQWASTFHHPSTPELDLQTQMSPASHHRSVYHNPTSALVIANELYHANMSKDANSSQGHLSSPSIVPNNIEVHLTTTPQSVDNNLYKLMNGNDPPSLSTTTAAQQLNEVLKRRSTLSQYEPLIFSTQNGSSAVQKGEFPSLADVHISTLPSTNTGMYPLEVSTRLVSASMSHSTVLEHHHAAKLLARGARNNGFSMHSEDFPELNGKSANIAMANYGNGMDGSQLRKIGGENSDGRKPTNVEHPASDLSDFSKALGDTAASSKQMEVMLFSSNYPKDTVNLNKDRTVVRNRLENLKETENIRSVSSNELGKYGMKGLLGRLSKEEDPKGESTALTMGIDINQLGFDFKSSEPLWTSFISPFDGAFKETEGKRVPGPKNFKLPSYYKIDAPELKCSNFNRFQLETLFYIFYRITGDVLQQLAAYELHNRQWRYHKGLKVWFTKAPGSNVVNQRFSYIFFDVATWEKRAFHDVPVTFSQDFMSETEARDFSLPRHMLGQEN